MGASNSGLFIAAYRISTDKPGATSMTVHLTVVTPGKDVSGQGLITNTNNPPLDLATELTGSYTHMTVMKGATHILVTAQGTGMISSTSRVITENCTLRMVLSDDWRTGTANFSWVYDHPGHVENATVEMIPATTPPAN